MKPLAALSAVFLALMPSAGANAAAKLSQVFTFDMLNAQIPYLGHIVRPAMHVFLGPNGTEFRDYQADGCHFQARVSSTTGSPAVQALSLELSSRCNFDFSAFHLTPLSTRGLTISKVPFYTSLGFESDCIYLCGNAADPTVEFIEQSSHATNWVGVVYSITIVSDPTIDAVETIRQPMQKREGEDYILQTRFNCDHKFTQLAIQAFANLPINRVTVGIFPDDAGGRCQ
jgi:hypothetical protein